jgi:hypothetical protein
VNLTRNPVVRLALAGAVTTTLGAAACSPAHDTAESVPVPDIAKSVVALETNVPLDYYYTGQITEGETCTLRWSGRVSKLLERDGRVVVKYAWATEHLDNAVEIRECPPDTKVELDAGYYGSLATRFKALEAQEASDAKQVATLVKRQHKPLAQLDTTGHPAVRVMNPDGIDHKDIVFRFWSQCELRAPDATKPDRLSYTEVVGLFGDQRLLRYKTQRGYSNDSQCPDGTLFLERDQHSELPIHRTYQTGRR